MLTYVDLQNKQTWPYFQKLLIIELCLKNEDTSLIRCAHQSYGYTKDAFDEISLVELN